MADFSLDDLNRLIGRVGAEFQISEDMLDQPFSQLGMDSLGIVELAEHISGEYNVPIPADSVEELRTPRLVADYVNRHVMHRSGDHNAR